MGTIRAARLENSKRLQSVFWLLADGREHSTRDVIRACDRCAINSIMDELRDDEHTDNGLTIDCKYSDGAHRYRMLRDAKFYSWRRRLIEQAEREAANA